MVRLAFLFVLLTALAGAAPASAWPFWLRKPETHGSRKTPGDYTHVRGSYRFHSREQHGLLSFLRPRRPNEVTARHHQAASHPPPTPRRSRMTL